MTTIARTIAAVLLLAFCLPAMAQPAGPAYPTTDACMQATKALRREQPQCGCIAELAGSRTAYVLQCTQSATGPVVPPRAEAPSQQPAKEPPAVAATGPDAMRAEQREPPGFSDGLYPQLRKEQPAGQSAPPQP